VSAADRVVVLVPRRAGVPDRDELWKFTEAWWAHMAPDWPIVVGDHDEGPFNRARALNRAAAAAGEWDVAVILDADMLVGVEQVEKAIAVALETGGPALAYTENVRLTPGASKRIMAGWRGDWRSRGCVAHVYTDMCSAIVVVTRKLWDDVRGFDEGFVGWGYEDNAFMAAAETMSGLKVARVPGPAWHLHHRAQRRTPALMHSNRARLTNYGNAHMRPDAMRAVIDGRADVEVVLYADPKPIIPAMLHRTVPVQTSAEVERWWRDATRLHPSWEAHTWRDPLNPTHFPLTAPLWERCTSGAQRAGLIRLEVLATKGGIYLDSDVQLYRSLEPLRYVPAFAAYEDPRVVPDAVLGCVPGHPAILWALEEACESVRRGEGAWDSGPGVTTRTLRGRADVLLLPPGSFYPYHYTEKAKRRREDHKTAQPWAFGAHHWAHSWA
jgi:hypothetical protein